LIGPIKNLSLKDAVKFLEDSKENKNMGSYGALRGLKGGDALAITLVARDIFDSISQKDVKQLKETLEAYKKAEAEEEADIFQYLAEESFGLPLAFTRATIKETGKVVPAELSPGEKFKDIDEIKTIFPYTGGMFAINYIGDLSVEDQIKIAEAVIETNNKAEDAQEVISGTTKVVSRRDQEKEATQLQKEQQEFVENEKEIARLADNIEALEDKLAESDLANKKTQLDTKIQRLKDRQPKTERNLATLEKAESELQQVQKQIDKIEDEIKGLDTTRDKLLDRNIAIDTGGRTYLSAEEAEAARLLSKIQTMATDNQKLAGQIVAEAQKSGFGVEGVKLTSEEAQLTKAIKEVFLPYQEYVLNNADAVGVSHTNLAKEFKERVNDVSGFFEKARQTFGISSISFAGDAVQVAETSDYYSIPFEEKIYPKTTVAKTKAVILERLGQAGVDRITVATTPKKAGLTDIEPTAAGVVIDGKPYLFTDNIAEGNELGVLMHEIGVHVGMPALVGQGNYKFLINKIKEFAKANDGSRESQLAKRASERVTRAAKIVDVNKDDELIAYFVEEAVNSGINPTSARVEKGKLGTFFRRLLAGIKNLLRKIPGINFKTYDAQDFVDFAYGGADLAIRNPDRKFTNAERAIQYSVAAPLGSAKDAMNSTFRSMQNAAPVWSQNSIDGILNNLSNLPDAFRKVFYNLLSLRQMADTVDRFGSEFKPIADGLRRLNDLVNQRRFAIDESRLSWQSKLLDAQVHKEGYTQADLEQFYEIVHESTIEEIDLRSDKSEVTSTDLYKRYMEVVNKSSDLSKYDLRKSYKIMADAYAEAGQQLLNFYRKTVNEGKPLTNDQKRELGFLVDTQGAIVPYFPLVREGSWWVDFTANGETFTIAFRNKREAEKAAAELAQDSDVKVDSKKGSLVYQRVRGGEELNDSTSGLKMLNQVQRALEKSLKNSPEKAEAIAQIKDTILKAYPANSLKRQFKKRKGIRGYRQDVFQNFAEMGLKFSNELALLDNVDGINEAVEALESFGAEGKVPPAVANVLNSVQKRVNFMQNPTPGKWASRLSWGGYTWFILGNISSALINLTQIPLVVYGLLGGEFGLVDAAAAIKDAFKSYFKFHKDDNTRLKVLGVPLADRTAFGGKFIDESTPEGREMKELYDAALANGIVRRTTSQELQETKFARLDSLTGRLVKTEMALGYVFQNSERAVREVSLIAAYKLAKKKYKDKKVAMDRAFEIVEQANGPALAEAGPELFQTGAGKVIGTFKRFALSQLYLQYKLLRDINPFIKELDKDPKLPEGAPSARALALRQFGVISGSAWLFAGAKGIPVYGAAELAHNLAQKALGDEDDELDLEFNMKAREFLGDMAFRGPMSHFLNIDLAGRTGFYGLMFRDDPYRRAEVGDFSYLIETLSGPAYAAFVRNPNRAVDKFNEGDLYGAIQTASPSFVRNIMKGFSLATEGAVNSKGVPIVEDISGYNAMMQILGFTPTTLSNAYQANEFLSRQARKITGRRSKLLLELNMAKNAGDFDGQQEIIDEIYKFNQVEVVRDTNQQIGGSTMSLSWKNFNSYLDEAVRGLRLPRDMRDGLVKQTGIEDPEDM
jgi:hypothetical protein